MLKSVLTIFMLTSLSLQVSAQNQCTVTHNRTLRYGQSYAFNNALEAYPVPIKLIEFVPEFKEQFDFDGSNEPLNFKWTDEIVKSDGIVEANKKVVYVELAAAYPVKFHPVKRESDNITLKYITRLKKQNADGTWPSLISTNVVCVNYAITWCGDGIVDANDGEACDSGDQNGVKGSHCSKTCQKE